VSVGASAQGYFTLSWAAPGIPGREAETGCARRVSQSPHVPSAEQSRKPPRVPNYARNVALINPMQHLKRGRSDSHSLKEVALEKSPVGNRLGTATRPLVDSSHMLLLLLEEGGRVVNPFSRKSFTNLFQGEGTRTTRNKNKNKNKNRAP
jgi:hypothetical protein